MLPTLFLFSALPMAEYFLLCTSGWSSFLPLLLQSVRHYGTHFIWPFRFLMLIHRSNSVSHICFALFFPHPELMRLFNEILQKVTIPFHSIGPS
jgi:hypothetical protein